MNQSTPDERSDDSPASDNNDTAATSKVKSYTQWFREYVRKHARIQVTAFEDKAAKDVLYRYQMENQLIHSSEKNTVIFDIKTHDITVRAFQDALWEQYPEATGVFTAIQNQRDVAVATFDSAEARHRACTCGVTMDNNLVLIGTATVDEGPRVRRIMLESLPIIRAEELGQIVQRALTPFGAILDVKTFMDEYHYFFGRGYAMLDVTPKENVTYRPLKHKITLENGRVVYAKWDDMPPYCNYCHKGGHLINSCSKLKRFRN